MPPAKRDEEPVTSMEFHFIAIVPFLPIPPLLDVVH
jgi:hypothetical protein